MTQTATRQTCAKCASQRCYRVTRGSETTTECRGACAQPKQQENKQ